MQNQRIERLINIGFNRIALPKGLILAGMCLFPVMFAFLTSVKGINFGKHWDEQKYQIQPVESALRKKLFLPESYLYPSLSFWVGVGATAPDVVKAATVPTTVGKNFDWLFGFLADQTQKKDFLIRLRAIYMIFAALSVLAVFGIVFNVTQNRVAAMISALALAGSWEFSYHSRWVATDTLAMTCTAFALYFCTLAYRSKNVLLWMSLSTIFCALACGAKYTAGLTLLFVGVFTFFLYREKKLSLASLALFPILFVVSFLFVTPGAYLEPSHFLYWIGYISRHYKFGYHLGHNVVPGVEHFIKSIQYLSIVSLSSITICALVLFGVALLGPIRNFKQNKAIGISIVSFFAFYILYMSTNGVMIVRNFLLLLPILCVSIGLCIAGRRWLTIVISCVVLLNCLWVYKTGLSIGRNTESLTLRAAAEYIQESPDKRFFISDFTKKKMANYQAELTNLVPSPSLADEILFFQSEVKPEQLPKNHHRSYVKWFGAKEVNLNYYPTWPEQAHLLVMNKERYDNTNISLQ